MRAPDFWWQRTPSATARLLSPLGALSGALTLARMKRAGTSPGVPVICIGNPTVGGAGKTPTVIHLARHLAAQGRQPAILTRGYGGRELGPLAVDPAIHTAARIGDEPLLLARAASTYVARDRLAGACAAIQEDADILIMDDGFQNPALTKTLSILVIDGGVGIGNGLCVPAGPLRTALAPQLARAQAMLILGEGAAGERVARSGYEAGVTVLRGRLAPDARAVSRLIGRRVLAFAGIGRPAKFFDTLRGLGVLTAATVSFPDHHNFTPAEIDTLRERATRDGLGLVTTEKDAVRLAATDAGRALLEACEVLPVRLALEPQSVRALDRLLEGLSV